MRTPPAASAAAGAARTGAPLSTAERERLRCGADVAGLPRMFGPPPVTGRLRARPADFVVTEQLGFVPSGAGEHLYLQIRKTGQNTRWVARQFERRLDLPPGAVGYAGLKDRHAVTSQWLSVHVPGRPDPEPSTWDIEGVEVLQSLRHTGKLRTGSLRGNRFRIVIRDLAGDTAALAERLERARTRFVPNYFGAQRFGHAGGNLDLLTRAGARPKRQARSFGLSALRAALFNLWVARRIDAGTWDAALPGEILYRPGDDRFVHAARLVAGEAACPTGLLWGVGENRASDVALADETAFFASFPGTCALLAGCDARTMRRPLWASLRDFDFALNGDTLALEFSLPRGQFATVAIREFGDFFDSA